MDTQFLIDASRRYGILDPEVKMDQWLSLTDYASKHRVSVSTLRRRIKNDKIEYKQDSGKYFVKDRSVSKQAIEKVPLKRRIAPHMDSNLSTMKVNIDEVSDIGFDTPIEQESILEKSADHSVADSTSKSDNIEQEDNSFLSTKLMLDEIKKAYMSVLQEKEEQLVSLKTEVADLKTLVRALESENHRLHSLIKPQD